MRRKATHSEPILKLITTFFYILSWYSKQDLKQVQKEVITLSQTMSTNSHCKESSFLKNKCENVKIFLRLWHWPSFTQTICEISTHIFINNAYKLSPENIAIFDFTLQMFDKGSIQLYSCPRKWLLPDNGALYFLLICHPIFVFWLVMKHTAYLKVTNMIIDV